MHDDTDFTPRRTNYRWVICGMLFLATTINYVDRQVFSILGPDLTDAFHWTERDYSYIVNAFTLAYAIGYAIGMFLVSPVWWFYLYWLPKFLKNNHHVDLQVVFLPLLVVYLLADVGSIGGGLSSWLIHRGMTVNFARKTALLVCAQCVTPVMLVARIEAMWPAVLLIGLAAAAHQCFSANLYTIVSDTVPRSAVSSVVGFGGTAAGLGMLVLSTLVGYILDWTELTYGHKDYLIPFLIAGSAYLMAVGIIHCLLPRLEPMAPAASEEAR